LFELEDLLEYFRVQELRLSYYEKLASCAAGSVEVCSLPYLEYVIVAVKLEWLLI
jgi:hypothetical protein